MPSVEPIPKTDPLMPVAYALHHVSQETDDTFTLVLEPKDGRSPESFQPGQFSMVWAFGAGEVPISISGDPSDAAHLTYTIRSVGPATRALVSAEAGTSVGVRGPFGRGWPVDAARERDVVIVAGGIGLAPLRPVIYRVLANRNEYGRLTILYGARRPADVLFREELVSWSLLPETQALVTVDSGDLGWTGHVGVVTTLFRHAKLFPHDSVAMICGPEVMMRFVAQELQARGMAQSNIFLSMERNMKCAVGFCGHCQWGPHFICKDGPVFPYSRIRPLLDRYEL
ncbi:MAG: FAD/NAD(P)-binding protein [Acidobacteriaceae bacterium]|nr:FAD/NAD(P)-binding protein [Acidobacteriaceae bacterium]